MSKQLEAIYAKLREIENTQNLSHYGYALIQDVKSAVSELEEREAEVPGDVMGLASRAMSRGESCSDKNLRVWEENRDNTAADIERYVQSSIAAAQNPYDKVLVAAMGDLNASDRCEWPNAKDHLAKIIQDTMGPRAYLEYLNHLPEAPKGKE